MSNSSEVMAQVAHHVQYIATLDVALPTLVKGNVVLDSTISLTEVIKAILNVYSFRRALGDKNANSISWLQGYIVCIVLSSGGASTVALLRGEPLSLLYKNEIWIINGLIYWCIFSNQYVFHLLHYLFEQFPVLSHVGHFIGAVSRGYGITRVGIDGGGRGAFSNNGKSPMAEGCLGQIVCGTLVGCATGVWVELFDLLRPTWKFTMPRHFLKPSSTVRISLWTSILYLMLLKPFYPDELAVAQTLSALFFAVLLCHDRLISVSTANKKATQTASSVKNIKSKKK